MFDVKLVPITDRLLKIEHSLAYAMDEITKISKLDVQCDLQKVEVTHAGRT